MLLRLFEHLRRFNVEIQPQLILLQKTLLNVEGLGRELYPELDIWHTAAPILREWMRERIELAPDPAQHAHADAGADRGGALSAGDPEEHAAESRGRHAANAGRDTAVELLHAELRRGHKQRDAVILGAAAVLGGIVWLALGREAWPGWTLAGCGAAWLLIVYRLF